MGKPIIGPRSYRKTIYGDNLPNNIYLESHQHTCTYLHTCNTPLLVGRPINTFVLFARLERQFNLFRIVPCNTNLKKQRFGGDLTLLLRIKPNQGEGGKFILSEFFYFS